MDGRIVDSISLVGRQKLSRAILRLPLLLLLIIATGSLVSRQAEARTQAIGCTEAEFDAALAALPNGGTLTFNCAPPAKITFTTTKNIVKQVTIDGSNGGGTEVTLDGGGTVQIFQVYTNNVTNGSLSVSHLTLSNGNAGVGCGGAISGAYGPVYAQNVTFKNNTANSGGAICGGSQNGIDGSVTVRDSTFDSNVALAGGGALWGNGAAYGLKVFASTFNNNAARAVVWAGDMYVEGSTFTNNSTAGCTTTPCDGAALSGGQGVTTTVTGSRFSNNSAASQQGGAIGGAYLGTLIIDHTLFDGNSALAGGAIYATSGGPSSIYLSDSIFQHNTAANDGGAIANSGLNSINRTLFFDNHATSGGSAGGAVDGTINGQATIVTNTTFYQNSAAYGGALGGRGALSIRLSTFVSNTASVTGSVLYDDAAYAHIDSIAQSIVSGSSSCATPGASVVSGGYSIASDSSCGLNAAGDQQGVDPRLAPFQNLGGYSWAIPPYSDSPAVDNVPLAACAVSVDQRGGARPFGTACDSGAVEGFVPAPPRPQVVKHESAASDGTSPNSVADDDAEDTKKGGDPVNTIFGNFLYAHTDLQLPGVGIPVQFVRNYNSALPQDGIIGFGWNLSYNLKVDASASPTVTVMRGDGRADYYLPAGGGNFTPQPGIVDQLVTAGGTYTLTTREQITYHFDSGGRLLSAADVDGNVDTLSYDNLNRWDGITDAAGRSWTLASNAGSPAHLVTITENATGRTIQYGYDGSGNLTSVTNPAGGVTSYAYDGAHQLTTITDAGGHVETVNVYDGAGKVIQQTDPRGTQSYRYLAASTVHTDTMGFATTTAFDPNYQIALSTDALGHTVSFGRNVAGQLVQEIDPLGRITRYQYDVRGNPTVITTTWGAVLHKTYDNQDHLLTSSDGLNHTTTLAYDAKGHLLTVTDASGKTTTYTYDGRGLRTSMKDPLNNIWSYGYDVNGNQTSITDPKGKLTTISFSSAGNVSSVQDSLSHTSTFSYNALNLLVNKTDANGGQNHYTYDAVGNMVTATDPLSHTTSFAYDNANDIISITDANSKTTSYTYDARGKPTQTTLPDGTKWKTSYDALGRPVANTTPLGFSTLRSYDAVGNLLSLTGPDGSITAYTYGSGNELSAVKDALGNISHYSHDAALNLKTLTNANGASWTFSYDNNNRLTGESNPLSQTRSTSYDFSGRLSSQTNALGQTVSFGYDAGGQVLTVTAPSINIHYSYDDAGNRTGMTDAFGATSYTYNATNLPTGVNSPQGSVGYAYDLAGRLSAMTQPGAALSYTYDNANHLTGVKLGGSSVVNYAYDNVGRPTSEQYANGLTTALSYDSDGRPTVLTTTGGSGTLESIAYSYDSRGNRITENSTDFSATYSYDRLSRLVGAGVSYNDTAPIPQYQLYLPLITRGGGTLLNPVRPRASASFTNTNTYAYTYDPAGNRLSESVNGTPTNFVYDAANRMTTAGVQSITHDAAGRLTADGVNTYAYDALDHLLSISGALSASYGYDGDGNRVSETIGATTSTYLLNTETALPMRIAKTNAGGTERYIYGLDRVLQVRSDGGRRYEHQDALGTVRALSSANGSLLDRMAYAPFGARLTGGVGGFGFTGEPQDASSGLVYLRARVYSPALGQFLSEDKFPGFLRSPASLNHYTYVLNNPINRTDPAGNCVDTYPAECLIQSLIANIQTQIIAQVTADALNNNAPTLVPSLAEKSVSMRPAVDLASTAAGGNLVAQGGGNVIGDNGSAVVSDNGLGVLSTNGSTLVAQGGGNLVAQGGGNLVAQGGGNVLSTNGSTLVASGAGNLVAQGGGNFIGNQASLVAQGGGNLVAQGGGNLVAQGGGNLVAQGGGN